MQLHMRSICLLALGLASCAELLPTMQVGDYPLVAEYWDGINRGVRPKAEFALACPANALQLTVLDAFQNELGYWWVRQVGVTGCGKRAVYVTSPNGWIRSS